MFNLIQELKRDVIRLRENPREYMMEIAKKKNPKLNHKYEKYFAKKEEIEPTKIQLELEVVDNRKSSEIWRSSLSFWSIPISAGYGRRIRFILWDKTHNKVFGIFGLCDPVIGLKVRDEFIGWDKKQKEERLYNLMSAYVLGAIPPYNELYGAKMVALAVGSKEVCRAFNEKYKNKKTLILQRTPLAKLVAVDTMAFFGKSLIYVGLPEWEFVGFTKGQTHVHLNGLWEQCLELAKKINVKSLTRNKFGQGPNWKFRVLREVFQTLGISNVFLSIGLTKGYYFRALAVNWREFLLGKTDEVQYVNKSFEEYFEFWKIKYLRRRVNRWNGKGF
jgi:hypothetical protein